MSQNLGARDVVREGRRYRIGDVLRYGSGPQNLMRVESFQRSFLWLPAVYEGPHCDGGRVCVTDEECRPASESDMVVWNERAWWRKTGVLVFPSNPLLQFAICLGIGGALTALAAWFGLIA